MPKFNLEKTLKNYIKSALPPRFNPEAIEQSLIDLPPEKWKDKFQLSSNIAMILGSSINANPMEIGKEICNNLFGNQDIAEAETISPGFINFKLTPDFWHRALVQIIDTSDFGFENYGNEEQVNIEYCSPNPTGPIHIGHIRGAVFGDVLSAIYNKCGYKVTKECYINDAGNQINILFDSILYRIKQLYNDYNDAPPANLYGGDYIIDLAKKLVEIYSETKNGNVLQDKKSIYIKYILDIMVDSIKKDLLPLNIAHDVFTHETDIVNSDNIENSLQKLEKEGYLYYGILDKPKGQIDEDWEEKEQLLFRSTAFGDDIDRPLKKSDGTNTYFVNDIAYHYNKYSRGFNKMILILGSDHKGYAKRINAATKAISDNKAEVKVKLYELVNLVKDGKPIKMSKRAGNFITATELLEYLDPGIIRFVMLSRKSESTLTIDIEAVKKQAKENPVFYVQYAYSRCCSIIRRAQEIYGDDILDYANQNSKKLLKDLTEKEFLEIIIKMSFYSKIIYKALNLMEVHGIIFYIIDLAAAFHQLWQAGVSNKTLQFVSDSKEQTARNLLVLLGIKKIINSIFDLLSIKPMETM